jgi:hypothetical protein
VGPTGPAPWFATHVRMLWDDTALYIAADLEDTRMFAQQTLHDRCVCHQSLRRRGTPCLLPCHQQPQHHSSFCTHTHTHHNATTAHSTQHHLHRQ